MTLADLRRLLDEATTEDGYETTEGLLAVIDALPALLDVVEFAIDLKDLRQEDGSFILTPSERAALKRLEEL